MIFLVEGRSIRFPTPYLPPTIPVLTSQHYTLCFLLFSANIFAYLEGCNTINASPKAAENVRLGSMMPTSVPATLLVYPLIKWYID